MISLLLRRGSYPAGDPAVPDATRYPHPALEWAPVLLLRRGQPREGGQTPEFYRHFSFGWDLNIRLEKGIASFESGPGSFSTLV